MSRSALRHCCLPALMLVAALMTPRALVADGCALSRTVTGGVRSYEVHTGETLRSIGAKAGVDAQVLAARNGLRPADVLAAGRILIIDNRHIVPNAPVDLVILVNVPQRMLFHFADGALAAAYPIGAGKPGWPTPLGEFRVIVKEEHPTWEVPQSIQAEMRRAGKPVLTVVRPGPNNPLGDRWIGLSLDSLGIHGTTAPTSTYQFQSHGCLRMQAEHVAALFDRIEVGARGRLIYEPVLLARTEEGIFLEAHRDVYRRLRGNPRALVERIAAEARLTSDIDWGLVDAVLARREGLALRVDTAPSR